MKTLSSLHNNVRDRILQSCLVAAIGICASAAPSEALPAGVPNQLCSEISRPRPGTLCYVPHYGQGGRSERRGSRVETGSITIQPQQGHYVVDSTVIEITDRDGVSSVDPSVLAVGASVESVSGYESRIREVDRIVNELEGRIRGIAGPAVFEARNRLTYLRERRTEYDSYSRMAISASRTAPKTVYQWRARPRSCGVGNLDTCGSSIWFTVYEVRRYLGDPIVEYDALLVPAINQARAAVEIAEQSSQIPPQQQVPPPQVDSPQQNPQIPPQQQVPPPQAGGDTTSGSLIQAVVDVVGILVGGSNPGNQNSQTGTQSTNSTSSQGGQINARQVYFSNQCRFPVRLALSYNEPSGQWVTQGWWDIDANRNTLLASNNQNIRSNNSAFFYYAEIAQEPYTNYSWSGNGERDLDFQGRTLRMRQVNLSLNSDGNYVLAIDCNSL